MPAEDPTTAPMSILVVDDNPDDLEVFQRTLRDKGWRITTADSGSGGLKKALAERFTVVVLDYNLGDMTGTQVLLRLKESGVTTPVLIQSGLGSHFIVARALALGAEDFISKESPTYAAELVEKIGAASHRGSTGLLGAARPGRRESVQEVDTVLDDLMERGQGRFHAVGFASTDGFRVSTRFKHVRALTPETICAMVASATSTCRFLGEGFDFPGLRVLSAEFEGGQLYAAPVAKFGILFASVPAAGDSGLTAKSELEFAAKELATLLSTLTRTEPYSY